MALSNGLKSQFAKIVNNDKSQEKKESIVQGTTVNYNGTLYVKIDGSDVLTPVSTTVDMKNDERVTVLIKDHTAIVTGNLSSPAASSEDVKEQGDKISEFDVVMAYKITTEDLAVVNATINSLLAKTGNFAELTTVTAKIEELQARYASLDKLSAKDAEILNAEIENLKVELGTFTGISTEELKAMNADIDNLKGYNADFTYVSADRLTAINADIKKLDVDKLTAEQADLKYATIDFSNIKEATISKLFTDYGIIKELIIGEGTVVKELVGVTIKGDLIEAGTLKADKLVVKGSDGIYYKLNVDALGESNVNEMTKEEQEQLQNGLHGSAIVAKSITAEKVRVDDLVAFGATIGGFNIGEKSIYSGVKESATNTTRGIYLDNGGQIAFGDGTNYLRYYKTEDGKYRLEVAADSIRLSSSNKTVEEELKNVNDKVNDIQVGGRNLFLNTAVKKTNNNYMMASYKPASEALVAGERYTCTICVTPAAGVSHFALYFSSGYKSPANFNVNGTGKQIISTSFIMGYFEGKEPTVDMGFANASIYRFPHDGTVTGNSTIHWIKIEKGNRATDWTPAPEDVDEKINQNASDIVTSSNQFSEIADNLQASIDIVNNEILTISNKLKNLVVDKDGVSMMEQSGDGWVFSMANTIDSINSAANKIEQLIASTESQGGDISEMKIALQSLTNLNNYVRISTEGTEPIIELGNATASKVQITNTEIRLMNGVDIVTRINTKLCIGYAELEHELGISNFALAKRSNGNVGFVRKG